MNVKRIYLIVAVVIVAAVVIIVILPEGRDSTQAETAQLPPGHPDVSGQMPGAAGTPDASGMPGGPSKANVRQDFMQQLETLRKHVDAAPARDTTGVLELARMLADSHQMSASIPYFERYLKVAPKNVDAMLDLSVAYYETKDVDRALGLTRRVLDVDPKNGIAQYNLGAIYATQKKTDEARQVWERLVHDLPGSPHAARAREALSRLSGG